MLKFDSVFVKFENTKILSLFKISVLIMWYFLWYLEQAGDKGVSFLVSGEKW